ncbi:uncharacterized protein LOC124835836 [Vigna umbellata]|uniref:uncharacterized protein LOC124835836 n=1 Tax=Vigna umbellata TaxID=87088 RepID=UPI001F5EA518|nr:uncharacterized protein LOC124835836 [Vigna umbellata]
MVMDAPNPSSSAASSFLANLPSRGHFSSTVVSSNPVLQFPFFSSHSLYFFDFGFRDLPTFTAMISDPCAFRTFSPSAFSGNVLNINFFIDAVGEDNEKEKMNIVFCTEQLMHGGRGPIYAIHDTSPPEGQHIKTNQQNILIRSLTLKKQRGDSSSKDGSDGSRKRNAEKVLERSSAKKTNNQINSRQEGSNSQTATRDLHNLTVERLRALLKAKGLSTKGKKEELITRLKDATG